MFNERVYSTSSATLENLQMIQHHYLSLYYVDCEAEDDNESQDDLKVIGFVYHSRAGAQNFKLIANTVSRKQFSHSRALSALSISTCQDHIQIVSMAPVAPTGRLRCQSTLAVAMLATASEEKPFHMGLPRGIAGAMATQNCYTSSLHLCCARSFH